MSNNLKENQVLAANLIASGLSVRTISKELNIREETICRWKKCNEFKNYIKKYQKKFLSNIEREHFSIIQKAMFNINKALDDENSSIKDKAELSIKYLRTTTSYLSKSINQFTYDNEKNLEKEKNKKELEQTEKQVDEILDQIAELKRSSSPK